MIQSCKYCMASRTLCPRCEQSVEIRTLVIADRHSHIHSATFYLCTNLNCKNYGEFQPQTADGMELVICEACQGQIDKGEIPNAANAS